MRLHENPILFRQAVQATAQSLGIQEIFVEKDYWVTYALHAIYNSQIGADTIFKGGTSLSKCFGLISRFSEDIDLVIKHSGNESGNQLKSMIKKVGAAVADVLPEVKIEGLTIKKGINRKTAHEYPHIFTGHFGQTRNVIVLEVTRLGYFEPYFSQKVNSCIFDMMIETGQKKIAEDYDMLPFEVQVLDPKRTICEKIMSLVRFSYSKDPIDDLQKKIRHIYDLYQLLEDSILNEFFKSSEFEEMMLRVARDDIDSFSDNAWLQNHPVQSLIFAELEPVWDSLKDTYNGDFRNLVYGEFPTDSMVLATLISIRDRLNNISWEVVDE